MQYKLQNNIQGETVAVTIVGQMISIPLDPDNTDYQTFKSDLANGAQLQAADGTEMTADQIKTFLEGLK